MALTRLLRGNNLKKYNKDLVVAVSLAAVIFAVITFVNGHYLVTFQLAFILLAALTLHPTVEKHSAKTLAGLGLVYLLFIALGDIGVKDIVLASGLGLAFMISRVMLNLNTENSIIWIMGLGPIWMALSSLSPLVIMNEHWPNSI